MKKNVSSIVLSFLLVASSVTGSFAANLSKDSNAGVKAYSHVKYLAETIGKRVQGTEGEYNARDYIKSVFDGLGYSSTLQEFEIERKIEDNTSDKVEILVHLLPNVSAENTIDALYAFTECEVSISPNICVIVEDKPQFLSATEILKLSTFNTLALLKKELELNGYKVDICTYAEAHQYKLVLVSMTSTWDIFDFYAQMKKNNWQNRCFKI